MTPSHLSEQAAGQDGFGDCARQVQQTLGHHPRPGNSSTPRLCLTMVFSWESTLSGSWRKHWQGRNPNTGTSTGRKTDRFFIAKKVALIWNLKYSDKSCGLNHAGSHWRMPTPSRVLASKLEHSSTSRQLKAFSQSYHTSPFQDRGLQIGWSTVFLAEYAGPLLVSHYECLLRFVWFLPPQTYLWFTQQPWLAYGDLAEEAGPLGLTQKIAAAAW